jgi:hypothetical protein
MAVSLIGKGNRGALRKRPTFHKFSHNVESESPISIDIRSMKIFNIIDYLRL